jgi:thiosulfate reductase cytochrome b subunit
MKWNRVSKIIRWALLAVAALIMISGLGISYFRVIETVTFGLLTKPLAFKLHDILWIPFAILLVFHVILSVARRRSR